MFRKFLLCAVCLASGLIGGAIVHFGEATESAHAYQLANEATLARLQAASCDAYWNKKDGVAMYALKQYAGFLRAIGEERVADISEASDELARTNIRLAVVVREMRMSEDIQKYTAEALKYARGGRVLKTMSLDRLEKFVSDLDSDRIP